MFPWSATWNARSVFAAIANMALISSARMGLSFPMTGFVHSGIVMNSDNKRKPKIAVYKFASCDGCQLSLLDAEDELLGIASAVDISYFPEASRAMLKGPYDIGLVEGSITTHHDADRIHQVRRECRTLITIGACATSGGIQALRNWKDVREFVRAVYATPQYISTLNTSTPVSEHVPVDFELRGCPINKYQLGELIAA